MSRLMPCAALDTVDSLDTSTLRLSFEGNSDGKNRPSPHRNHRYYNRRLGNASHHITSMHINGVRHDFDQRSSANECQIAVHRRIVFLLIAKIGSEAAGGYEGE